MDLCRYVNYVSLDQSVKLPSYNYRNINQKIYKIKEAIRRAHSIKSLHKSNSQPRLPRYASKMVMANFPLTSNREKIVHLKKTINNNSMNMNSKSKDKDLSILLMNTSRENLEMIPVSNAKSKIYYPVIKSQCQLIEDLRGVVVNISQYKSNGPMIHQMRSEYLIDRLQKEELLKKEKILKSKQAMRPLDEEEEINDVCKIEDPVDLELKLNIREYLRAKDNKLNQVKMTKQQFFTVKENIINFNYDAYIVPHLKNNLHNYPTQENQMVYFNTKNIISPGILKYLYLRRLKLQKEKDDQEYSRKTSLNDQQLDDKNDYENESFNSEKLMTTKKAITKGLTNLEIKMFEKESLMPQIDIPIFELEDFFINKYIRYETQIASEKNKEFILTQFHDMSFQKYYQRHIPKLIS